VSSTEVEWSRRVDGRRIVAGLRRKVAAPPGGPDDIELAVCAGDEAVHAPDDVMVISVRDVFTPITPREEAKFILY
jgi:hypothetical protein